MPDSVTVIIPTYYRYECLRDTLDGIGKQTVQPLEILVPDQTPKQDRPENFYADFENRLPIKVMNIESPSLSQPRNQAASIARGDVLLFLDDDIVFSNTLIESHLSVMEREHVDVVNGAVSRHPSLPKNYPWDVTALDPVRYFLAAPNYQWEGMALSVTSGNFCIRKEAFLAGDGFDEKLPRMVDFELGYRLFRRGLKMYFSHEPFVQHLRAPGGSRKKADKYDRLISSLYIHKKHFPGWITTQFMLKVLIGCYFNRWTIFTPLKFFKNLFELLYANRVVNRKLREA